MEKRNLLLTIAYDGRAYHGWQIQENALSVQEVFQGALRQVIGDDFDVKGCSRTDSGVHSADEPLFRLPPSSLKVTFGYGYAEPGSTGVCGKA